MEKYQEKSCKGKVRGGQVKMDVGKWSWMGKNGNGTKGSQTLKFLKM